MPHPSPEQPPAKPTRILGGRVELLQQAGVGGMATVWRARLRGAAGFERIVAVKQIHPHLAEVQLYVDMFVEEARVGAALDDANIAQVHDFQQEDGQYYLIMDWVEGIDLARYVRYFAEIGEPLRWELATAVGIGLLRALAAAHEHLSATRVPCPIIHRDVSANNILLSLRGRVKLIDFGLSLARDRSVELTEPGVVKGKLAYLAPEIVEGERPSVRSDQFAAGVVLWEALTGRRMFDGLGDVEIYRRLIAGVIPPLRPLRPDLPRGLVAAVQRALSCRPEERFRTVREMAHQLSVVLATSRLRKDLHETLSRTVTAARVHFGDRRPDDLLTPIADAVEGLIGAPEEEERRIWHWLPFMRRPERTPVRD